VQFGYEAMTKDGQRVADTLEAATSAEAADQLRGRGMVVFGIRPQQAGATSTPARRGWDVSIGSSTPSTRDLVLFTRQMKMLLESGAMLVPALEAVGKQARKPALLSVIAALRDHVEQGGTLSEALREQPAFFKPVFCSMVAAGESTGTLPQVFNQLSELTLQQERTKKLIIGALTYPTILCSMLVVVMGVLLGFVLPRFAELFSTLHATLPASTRVLLDLSKTLRENGVFLGAGLVASVASGVILFRMPVVRARLSAMLLRIPMIGPIKARLTLGRVLRIWSAMLRCHVSLLETLSQSKSVAGDSSFERLIADLEESISSGGLIGRTMAQSRLVEPVVAAAVETGEENGRLAESVAFVSDWIDEDNAQLVASATRLAEPVILAVLGSLVGLVAMSLFLPLFDLASAT